MTLAKAQKTVVVAGAGYAGVLAANRLAGKLPRHARVVLVSMGDKLVDRVRLHEAAARGSNVERALDELLHPSVERIDARVVGLDAATRTLTFERGARRESLSYDALILALGSRLLSTLPSQSRHAFALANMESAHDLARDLSTLAAGERVAIVGGGSTAIELAAEIAEEHPHLCVEMFTSELAPALAGPGRDAIAQALSKLGVIVRAGQRVVELEAHGLRLADGSRIPVAISVLAAGLQPAELPAGLGLPRDGHGRVPVDEQLRVIGLDDVFAAGDLAAPPAHCVGSGLLSTRMGCATAMPLGAHAASQVSRLFAGEELVPYHYAYTAQCISVGRRQGVVVAVDADDRPTGRVLTGRGGALVKELICRLVIGAIRLERMFAGLYSWPRRSQRRVPSLPRADIKRLPS